MSIKDYYDPKNESRKTLWMIGLEDDISIKNETLLILRVLEDSMYIPLNKLYFPNDIKAISFVAKSNHAYFTLSDQKRTIFAQLLPDPKEYEQSYSDYQKAKIYYDTNTYPKILLDDDIIALSATEEYLFALTLSKAPNYKYIYIYIIDVDPLRGFSTNNYFCRSKLNINLENHPEILNISFLTVSISYNRIKFYLSGIKGANIYTGIFKPNDSIDVQPFIPLLFGKRGNLESTLSLSIDSISTQNMTGRKCHISLMAVDRANNNIYEIIDQGEGAKIREIIFQKSNKDDASDAILGISKNNKNKPYLINPLCISCLEIDCKLFYLDVNIKQNRYKYYFVSSANPNLVWYFNSKKYLAFQLLGGGNSDISENKSNLRDYFINQINTILPINYRCIIFGNPELKYWTVLLLPSLASLVKNVNIKSSTGKKSVKLSKDLVVS